jgi:hypothetical protein
MITIKNNSNLSFTNIHKGDIIEYREFCTSENIDLHPINLITKKQCDYCECMSVAIIVHGYSCNEYTQIYETEIKNIIGFEHCKTTDECENLIYRKVCDLHGIAYSGDEATLHPVFLRHLKQRTSDQF